MKTHTFKEWDLDKLEDTFGLTQVWESNLMTEWQTKSIEIEQADQVILLRLQKSLIRGGRSWNEVELENKFISPLIMLADIDDDQIAYFLERPLTHILGDYQLSGIVDGMIATGVRNPHQPYFCLHEYKRSIENQGTPDGQVLVAMLVARELNKNKMPIYGLFVVGLVWNFIILKGNEYCISNAYVADNKAIFSIFKMIKALKKIIEAELNKST
ncbi:MAG: hypothetical protein Q9M50_14475 [Methylococcales bacterium]|nr:hypothetical protein [Methylococcales bacterium]